jgi:hypothetical protein
MSKFDDDEEKPALPLYERYGLEWWVALPSVVLIAAQVIAGTREAADTVTKTDALIGNITGRCIAAFLISMLISWILFRVFGRSRLAASITFSIVAVLFALIAFSEGNVQRDKAMRVAAGKIQELRDLKTSADAAQKRLIDAGGIDIRPPRDAEEAKARLALVDEFSTTLRKYINAGDRAAEELKTQTRDHPSGRPIIDEFNKRVEWSKHRPVLVDVEAAGRAGREILVFLIDRPGNWRVNDNGSGFLLDDGDDAAPFYRLQTAFVAAIEKMESHASPASAPPPQPQ